jgi:hypothetical protein
MIAIVAVAGFVAIVVVTIVVVTIVETKLAVYVGNFHLNKCAAVLIVKQTMRLCLVLVVLVNVDVVVGVDVAFVAILVVI